MSKEELKQDNTKWLITLYHRKHWGGMTLRRLRIGWDKRLFWEWEKGGYVIRKPIF